MIAFHFPPLAGSSGIQRTLRFVQQLPHFGWQPIVLTASTHAYEQTSSDLLSQIPAGTPVCRAFALNATRHLAIAGRYPGFLARPDRWSTWLLGAVPAGLDLIHRLRPRAIWSTYPIPTAHRIARNLSRICKLPWVADFRDPMAQDGYPSDPATWRCYKRVEEAVVRNAAASVFVTRSAAETYRNRYPSSANRIRVIENGFDESSFNDLPGEKSRLVPGRFCLLHSGIVYPSERDPTALFRALHSLRVAGRAGALLVRFRASANDSLLLDLARRLEVADLIEVLPPIPYRDALSEMLRADGLLVLQASNCNEQIPAKVYEYLRAGRPILGLTDPAGDTAELLLRVGIRHLAPLENADAIAPTLESFLRDAPHELPGKNLAAAFSRQHRTAELSQLLNEVAA